MFKAEATLPQLLGLKQEVLFWQTWCSVLHTGAFWEEGQGVFLQKSKMALLLHWGIFFLYLSPPPIWYWVKIYHTENEGRTQGSGVLLQGAQALARQQCLSSGCRALDKGQRGAANSRSFTQCS